MILRMNVNAHMSAVSRKRLQISATPFGGLHLGDVANDFGDVSPAVKLILVIDQVRPVSQSFVTKVDVVTENVVDDALSRLFVRRVVVLLQNLWERLQKGSHATGHKVRRVKRRLNHDAETEHFVRRIERAVDAIPERFFRS